MIEIGDVVVLKSGGPKMTVESINQEGEVTCVWFDKDEKKEMAFFPIKLLEKWE